MPFEVEIKFRNISHEELARKLAEMGAESSAWVEQVDDYLCHPMRDFAETGEALRVRSEGGESRLTYKGPKHRGPTKTREEIEIAFGQGTADHEQMRRLWDRLGFRTVAILHKRRQTFHLTHRGRDVSVVLDLSEHLGSFAEVETIAADATDLPEAQVLILELASTLGLTEVESQSYLSMTLRLRESS